MAPHFNVLDLTRLGSSSELRRPPRWGRAGIGLIICSRQPRSISIRDTAPVIRTWFSSTAASDADIQQRLELLHYVRQAAHFRGEFSHMLENLPHSLKVCHQLVKKQQFTQLQYESATILCYVANSNYMKMKRYQCRLWDAADAATLVFVDIAPTVNVVWILWC